MKGAQDLRSSFQPLAAHSYSCGTLQGNSSTTPQSDSFLSLLLGSNDFLRGGGESAQHQRHRYWESGERGTADSFI